MSSKAQKVYLPATLYYIAVLCSFISSFASCCRYQSSKVAKLKKESDEKLSVFIGSAYFNLLTLVPTINFASTISSRLGLTGLYEEFKYPALVLLPILSLAKDGYVYFIALRNYHQAAGKTSAMLYLLVLLAIEVAIVWIVLANVPVTGKQ